MVGKKSYDNAYKNDEKRQTKRHSYRVIECIRQSNIKQLFVVPANKWECKNNLEGLCTSTKPRLYRGKIFKRAQSIKVGDVIDGYIAIQTGGHAQNKGKKLLLWCFPNEKFIPPR